MTARLVNETVKKYRVGGHLRSVAIVVLLAAFMLLFSLPFSSHKLENACAGTEGVLIIYKNDLTETIARGVGRMNKSAAVFFTFM